MLYKKILIIAFLTLHISFFYSQAAFDEDDISLQQLDLQQLERPSQQEQDSKSMAEEKRLRSKRTAEQNALIDNSIEEFYAAVQNIDFLLDTTDEDIQEQIDTIENFKQTIQFVQLASDTDTEEIEESLKTELKSHCDKLESTSGSTTSLTGALKVKGATFRSKTSSWTISVTGAMFGVDNLFSIEVPITYTAFTNTTYTRPAAMTTQQREEYENNIMIYDSFFRQSIPLVYAKLSYKIQIWKEPSEYRFVPQECKIYRTDKNRVVATIYSQDMQATTFTYNPITEIRSQEEIEEDDKRVASILQEEADLNALYAQALGNGASKSRSENQRKRTSLYITTDTMLNKSDFSNFDIKNVTLNAADVNLTLGFRKYFFVGGTVGYDFYGKRRSTTYMIGVLGGVSYTLLEYIRPFALVTLAYHTDKHITPRLGGGVDFMAGKIMLNLGYNFQWDIDLSDSYAEDESFFNRISTGNLFYIGVGLSI